MALNTSNLVGRKYDVEPQIALLNDSRFPLLTILTGERGKDPVSGKSKALAKKPVTDPEFHWYEDAFMSMQSTVAATQSIDPAAGGSFNVVAGDGAKFRVGDVIHVVSQKWNFEITAISGDTLTVGPEIGGAAGGTAVDISGSEVFIIGNAHEEGSGLPQERFTNKVKKIGYTQIFKTTYSITETARATKTLIQEDELKYQRRKNLIEHAVQIEQAFLFGKANVITSGAAPKRYTEGIINAIKTHAVANVNTEAAFNDFLKEAFADGDSVKYMFASPAVLSMIASWAQAKAQLNQRETSYGMRIYEYRSPLGTLMLIKHDLLQGTKYGNYAIVLDMKNVRYRYIPGRDTNLKTDVQNPDEDAVKERYLTEAGLQIMHETTHAIMSMGAL